MVHISLNFSLHHCLNSDFRAWPWMSQGEGTWGAADIPPGGIWGFVYFLQPDFKWNTLALIFQHPQVSEMPKPMSQTSLSVPQSALSFPGGPLVPTGCRVLQSWQRGMWKDKHSSTGITDFSWDGPYFDVTLLKLHVKWLLWQSSLRQSQLCWGLIWSLFCLLNINYL